VARSTLGAQSAENELAFANNSLTEGTGRRPGHVIPFHIFDVAASIANEVVMANVLRIEPRGAALDSNFAHQTGPHQIPQIVVSRGPGRAGIDTIDGLEDFCGRGVPGMIRQESHHGVALRSAPQPAAF